MNELALRQPVHLPRERFLSAKLSGVWLWNSRKDFVASFIPVYL